MARIRSTRANLNGNEAKLITSTLTVGVHPISAFYTGQDSFPQSTSAVANLTINQVRSAFQSLARSQSIAYRTANVVLSGTVVAAGGLYPNANETVSIKIGTGVQAASIGANGAFSMNFPTSGLAAGSYPIQYSYAGDTNLSAVSDSSTTLTVGKGTPVFSAITPSQTINFGAASVTLQGTVSLSGTIATGTVTATINNQSSAAATLDSSGSFKVIFNTSTIPGSATAYPITYQYSGDTNFNQQSDQTTTLTVMSKTPSGPVVGRVTLSATPNPAVDGDKVVFTFTVAEDIPGVVPTGNVSISETVGMQSIYYGNANLANGTGTLTVDSNSAQKLAVGTHPMYATYGGDTNYQAATSPAYTMTVNAKQ